MVFPPSQCPSLSCKVCWYLTREVEKKLNNWAGAKMVAITGKSRKYENSKRRVNVYHGVNDKGGHGVR